MVWFQVVSGLSAELTDFAVFPLQIMALLPGLSVLLAYQRAVLVSSHHTTPITYATALEMLVMVSVLFLSVYLLGWIGAIAAATAYFVGRSSANILLIRPVRQFLAKIR